MFEWPLTHYTAHTTTKNVTDLLFAKLTLRVICVSVQYASIYGIMTH